MPAKAGIRAVVPLKKFSNLDFRFRGKDIISLLGDKVSKGRGGSIWVLE